MTASVTVVITTKDGLRAEEKSKIKCTVSLLPSARTYASLEKEEQESCFEHPGLNSAVNYTNKEIYL